MNDVRIELKGLRADGTLEVPIGTDGWLILDGSTVIGQLKVSGAKVHFKWSSSTVAWPSDFTIEKPAGQTVPSLSIDDTYEHQAFPSTSGSHDVSGCDYKIVSGGNVVGWLKRNGSDTEWYGVPAHVSGGYLVVSNDTLTFKANDTTTNQTAHKLIDDVI